MKLHFADSTYTENDVMVITSFSTTYKDRVLKFCKQWLLGQTEFILHTSGSTGTPKPISIYRQQMEASARMTAQKLQLFENTKALVCLNADFIAGKMMLVRGMLHNWEIFIIEPNSLPFNALEIIFGNQAIDFVALVPLQLQQTLQQTPEKIATINQLKAIILGGAAVSKSLAEDIQKYVTVPTYSTYGMTETVSHIALKKLNQEAIFELLPNIEIATDNRNCLKIKGLVTNHEWLQTNDVVELHYNQSQIIGFQWIGRADNIINSGGIKIQLEKIEKEVEEIFMAEKINHRFFATGILDDLLGEKLVLVIEDATWQMTKQTTFLANLKTKLSSYEVPKNLFFVEKFAETPTLKIDKNKTLLLLS